MTCNNNCSTIRFWWFWTIKQDLKGTNGYQEAELGCLRIRMAPNGIRRLRGATRTSGRHHEVLVGAIEEEVENTRTKRAT